MWPNPQLNGLWSFWRKKHSISNAGWKCQDWDLGHFWFYPWDMQQLAINVAIPAFTNTSFSSVFAHLELLSLLRHVHYIALIALSNKCCDSSYLPIFIRILFLNMDLNHIFYLKKARDSNLYKNAKFHISAPVLPEDSETLKINK